MVYGALAYRTALWAARRYAMRSLGKKALGYGGAAAAGALATAASSYARKRKRTDSGTAFGAEKPQNSDTRLNLNSTFSSTSLYTRNRKRRRLSKKSKVIRRKKIRFAKKIKKVIKSQSKWNWMHTVKETEITNFATPYAGGWTKYTGQDVYPPTTHDTTPSQYAVGVGPLAFPNESLNKLQKEVNEMGHVEDGAVQTDVNIGERNTKIEFTERLQFTMSQNKSEFTGENPMIVDIYECVAAKNITELAYSTPTKAWASVMNGYNFPIGAGVTTAGIHTKGVRPTDNDQFGKWWKVNQVTRVRMVHETKYQYDMTTSGVYEKQKHANSYAIPGVTKQLMFVIAPVYVEPAVATYDFRYVGVTRHLKFRPVDVPGVTPNEKVQWSCRDTIA